MVSGLKDIQGMEIMSDPLSPIVFLRLKKSTGSSKSDLKLLEDIADRVSDHLSVSVVSSYSVSHTHPNNNLPHHKYCHCRSWRKIPFLLLLQRDQHLINVICQLGFDCLCQQDTQHLIWRKLVNHWRESRLRYWQIRASRRTWFHHLKTLLKIGAETFWEFK